jgi:DNA polymerase III subunit gamma/tau
VFDRGHDLKKVHADLIETLRNLLVIHAGKDPQRLIDLPPGEVEALQGVARRVSPAELQHVLEVLYREEPAMRLSSNPKLALEMAFFKARQRPPALTIEALIRKLDELRREVGGADAGPPPPAQGAPQGRPQHGNPPILDEERRGRLRRRGRRNLPRSRACRWMPAPEGATPPGSASAPASPSSSPASRPVSKNAACAASAPGAGKSFRPTTPMAPPCCGAKNTWPCCGRSAPRCWAARRASRSPRTRRGPAAAPGRRERSQALVQQTLNHPLVAEAIDIFNGKLVDVQILQEVDK